MVRDIITIDQEKCTGCGACVTNCPEGAIRIIDGKARLVSDLMCDGLGACIGHCPENAITIERRDAQPYDELKVMPSIVAQGTNTVRAHLEHLRDHGQAGYLATARAYLAERNIADPLEEKSAAVHTTAHAGCPGARSMAFTDSTGTPDDGPAAGTRPSRLTHWPVQLHLISPTAPHYRGADVLLSADCVAFALGDFHKEWLKGKALAIACPKLDDGQDVYIEKIQALVDDAGINTLTVMIMQVPCCGGLLQIAKTAVSQARRKIPIKRVVVGLQGAILSETWE